MEPTEPEEHKSVDQGALRKIIEQLRRELDEIQYAIHTLEALALGERRRGRPPKFIAERQTLLERRRKTKTVGTS
jgi:hypothetical protein